MFINIHHKVPVVAFHSITYPVLLAHLSLKADRWAYSVGRLRRPSSTLFKHLLLRNGLAVKVKFHMDPRWDGGKTVCSNGPGHMTKMAATPICGKNLKKSSSPELKGQWPWKLVCSIRSSSTTKFVQMMILSWPWPILWQGQIWSLILLYGKKVKKWIFQKLF